MATKPNETYKWGENATHEQVAAYSDTGWPADNIPPKRTQFNWYQNLVGRWLGWAESAIDDIMSTVVDKWFVELPNALIGSVPNEDGIYWYKGAQLTVIVFVRGNRALRLALADAGLTARTYEYTSSWSLLSESESSNNRTSILQESPSNYVTPMGLVDYFSVKDTTYTDPTSVPHKSGMHIIKGTLSRGFAFVADDSMASVALRGGDQIYIEVYEWNGTQWVLQ